MVVWPKPSLGSDAVRYFEYDVVGDADAKRHLVGYVSGRVPAENACSAGQLI